MSQEEGLLGKAVGAMIRSAVKKRFHTIYWIPPATKLQPPVIFAPNHHGWFDGYLMFLAATKLEIRIIDWIAEFEAFPLFAKVGGMPFPANDATKRTETVRKTLRLMQKEHRSLLLFAEGQLHYPPEVLPLERSLEFISTQVPDAKVIPVAIVYEHALHERPEAFLNFGKPTDAKNAHPEIARLLEETKAAIRGDRSRFEVLAQGTRDINERMDMRRFRKS